MLVRWLNNVHMDTIPWWPVLVSLRSAHWLNCSDVTEFFGNNWTKQPRTNRACRDSLGYEYLEPRSAPTSFGCLSCRKRSLSFSQFSQARSPSLPIFSRMLKLGKTEGESRGSWCFSQRSNFLNLSLCQSYLLRSEIAQHSQQFHVTLQR